MIKDALLIINSIGLFVTATFLYLTIRQLGLVLGRLGPVGARSAPDVGPRVGENLSPILDSDKIVSKNGKPTLYVFGSDSCGVCSRVKSGIETLVKHWKAKSNIILIYDGEEKGGGNPDYKNQAIPVIRSNNVRGKLGVGLVPFGVIVDSSGVVLGKGIVNEISHVESLLEIIDQK